MVRKNTKFTPEFREMAVKEVIDHSRPIADVARELGIVDQTLGNWVKKGSTAVNVVAVLCGTGARG